MLPSTDHTITASNITREQMRLLLTAALAINRSLNPQEIAQAALWLALDTLRLQIGMVLLFQDGQQIVLASQGFSDEWLNDFQSLPLNLNDSAVNHAVKTGRAQIYDALATASSDVFLRHFWPTSLQSLVCLPLEIPGNAPGLMLVGNPQAHQFLEEDVHFLQDIAGQIGVSLRNAWLYAQSQRRLKELETVAEAARTVVSSLDLDQILVYIMQEVSAQLNVEAAAILLLDQTRQMLTFAAAVGPESDNLHGIKLRVGEGIVGWVAEHDCPLLVPDVTQDPRFYQGLDKKTKTVTRSVICVPLRARNELVGVMEVINKKRGQFSKADQRLLEALAAFAAVAIENARSYEEANRQIQQATMYARDLNASYKQEREQREALDQLRHSFLNVVGHELKTPLTIMLQGLEAFRHLLGDSLNAEQVEIIDMVNHQAGYLRRLIDGLVTFARFSARQCVMKLQPESFEAVLDEVMMLARFKANPKRIVLEEDRQTPLPTLRLDKEQISEALIHLIDNAIKFSPEGSRVIVRTKAGSGRLKVSIIDQGRGIPTDQIDHIWDSCTQMNTTLQRGLEGLGLGLAIVRHIVEAHHGEVSVDSQPGQGSTFEICLPYGSK